ncbi:MAG: bifunctional demethylmenaquinone methyltransferase/2-methoxy-6-polyprenyl-1,4-benzoquinol methylase UbiE [Thermodesulfovibrionia bacterium]
MKLSKETTRIQQMFSSIAPHYDLLNRLLSLGRDRHWRRFAVSNLPMIKKGIFLDVATGTGDVAIEIAQRYPRDVKIIGVDISEDMIKLGIKKIERLGLNNRIELQYGDVNNLPFEDGRFDAALIAFGIRNVENYERGIREMVRVVKDGGRVIILEFTSLKNPLFIRPYHCYVTRFLPFVGEILSGRKGAYRYLPDSMVDFPTPEGLRQIMEVAGLRDVQYFTLTFGITSLHVGVK